MYRENPGWGAPRIHGELLKPGFHIGESSVSKYMVRSRRPPSQTWRTFLENHAQQLVSIDFFTVPTLRFQVLYVFLVLAHDRRRILHFNVTAHPTAEWTGQQLREAFPFGQLPRYLLRDRDTIFGRDFQDQVRDMAIREVLSAPRSPWKRAYVERVIGSIRRECLDHLIVFNEVSLRRTLRSYFHYYHKSRTHLSLAKDSPEPRPIQPVEMGRVVAVLQVDFTTATNDGPPEQPLSSLLIVPVKALQSICASSLCGAQFVDPAMRAQQPKSPTNFVPFLPAAYASSVRSNFR